jgi:hypothetical protein
MMINVRKKMQALLSLCTLALLPAGAGARTAGGGVPDTASSTLDLATSAALHAVFCSAYGSIDAGRILRGATSCQVHLTASSLAPQSCYTSTIDGNVLTLALNDCSGAAAGRQVTGTLTATVTKTATAISVETTGAGIAINTATADIDETVSYVQTGPTGPSESVTVVHRSSGVSARGNSFNDLIDYTLVLTRSCKTLNGSWNIERGTTSSSTTVSNYARCMVYCPASGVVTETRAQPLPEKSTTFTYDGTDVVKLTTSNGTSGTLFMACTPQP